jgi:hypothetical protein
VIHSGRLLPYSQILGWADVKRSSLFSLIVSDEEKKSLVTQSRFWSFRKKKRNRNKFWLDHLHGQRGTIHHGVND